MTVVKALGDNAARIGFGCTRIAAERTVIMTTERLPALQPSDALLVVDVQYDFLPGGQLAVARGNEVIAPLNHYVRLFAGEHLPIVATRDWHPADHCSFEARGGPWPSHCVAGTRGAEFASELHLPADVLVVSKATQRDREAYSAFAGTGLEEALRKRGVQRLFVGGLATDYCVVNTTRDALEAGFSVVVLIDAIRAIDAHPGDGERAIADMRARGAALASLEGMAG